MTWSEEQTAFVHAWTEALLAFGKAAFPRGTVTDVVAWEGETTMKYSSFHFALVGDAAKLAAVFGYSLTGDESDEDIMAGARTGPIASATRQHLRAKSTAEGFGHDRQVGIPDFFGRLCGQAIYEFANDEMPFDEVHGAWILDPGYPWPENDRQPFSYWSAKKARMISPERPAWLIQVEDDSENPPKTALGINPCLVFPAEPQRQEWPLWARAKGTDIVVAHSMSLPVSHGANLPASYRYQELNYAIEGVRTCGGLLFPSISYGPTPAANFGAFTLVGHMGLVLDGLKPYKKRGVDPACWVYEHDAWTIKTRELMTDVAIRLFGEMHGHEDYLYGHNFWTLGPPAEIFSGPAGGSRPIKTAAQLAAVARRRGQIFNRNMSEQEFDAANTRVAGTLDKYAYGEAKGRRVISLDEFPFFIGPKQQRAEMEAFANGVGYRGSIVTIDDPVGIADGVSDYIGYQWACLVADVIKKLGKPMDI